MCVRMHGAGCRQGRHASPCVPSCTQSRANYLLMSTTKSFSHLRLTITKPVLGTWALEDGRGVGLVHGGVADPSWSCGSLFSMRSSSSSEVGMAGLVR